MTDQSPAPSRRPPPVAGLPGGTPDLRDIRAAAELLDGITVRTPVLSCPAPAWSRTPGPVLLKAETLQRTGCFKARGAFVRVARLPSAVRARGLVAASAGNHAQGVALAARHFGVTATVYMPAGAPRVKVTATRSLGAQVRLVDGGVDGALEHAAAHARRSGATMVHPFDDADVIAGQATVGLEILEQVPGVGTILVGVGGGGLLAGIASVVRQAAPSVRVVGVQAAGADSFAASFRDGVRVTCRPSTFADGIAVRTPGALPFRLGRALVDEVVTVDDRRIWTAMRHVWRHRRIVAEPAGAVALAGLAAARRLPGPVVAVLSGANIDHALGARLLSEPHDVGEARGRASELRV